MNSYAFKWSIVRLWPKLSVILTLAVIFNRTNCEIDVHYKKLSNFVVTKLDNGAYFSKNPTSRLRVFNIWIFFSLFLIHFLNFKLIVELPTSCMDLFLKFGVKTDAKQLIYTERPDKPVKVYCRNSQLIDGTKLM